MPDDIFASIRNLYHVDAPNGFAPWELDMAEACLCHRLPCVLRDYYLELGRDKRINRTQDFLIEPDQLKWEDDTLTVFIENQGVCRWYLRRSEIERDNPPVWYQESGDVSAPCHGTLSDFLVSIAFYNAVVTLPEMYEGCVPLNAGNGKVLGAIANAFAPVAVPMPRRCGGIRYFANTPDSVLAVFGADSDDYLLMWAATTARELHDMTSRIQTILAGHGMAIED